MFVCLRAIGESDDFASPTFVDAVLSQARFEVKCKAAATTDDDDVIVMLVQGEKKTMKLSYGKSREVDDTNLRK